MGYPPIDTDRALAAFAYLTREMGPTVRELQDCLGLSSSSVADYRLQRMQELGYIERTGDGVRPYRLTLAGRERVAAAARKAAS